ncbi:MAG: MG2 domain-containing protein [Elusimicrobiales bacterium]
MKLQITGVSGLFLSAFAACAAAGALDGADSLFGRGLYNEAISSYGKAASPSSEDGLKAAYRAVYCEILLDRCGEAVRRLEAMPRPSAPLWQARFLLLEAEAGRAYLAHYGYGLPEDAQEQSADITHRTAAQWRARIDAAYDALWPLRDKLAAAPLKDEGYFINIKNAELGDMPSLWDFAVSRWTSFLLEGAPAAGPKPDVWALSAEQYKHDYDGSAPAALKAAAVYEGAGAPCAGRQPACDNWKMDRLLLPVKYGWLVSANQKEYGAAALKVLQKWSALPGAAGARAAFEAASLLNDAGRYGDAVEICKKAQSAAPDSYYGKNCARLSAEIRLPRLEFSARSAPPGGRFAEVSARNLEKVHFRAWKTTPQELSSVSGQGIGQGGAETLRFLTPQAVDHFLGRRPDAQWSDAVSYPAPHGYKNFLSSSPALGAGIYVTAACGDAKFEKGRAPMSAAIANITSVFLAGSGGLKGDPEDFLFDPQQPRRRISAELFRLYALDAVTGKPVPGARISYRAEANSVPATGGLFTGQDGAASYAAGIMPGADGGCGAFIDPLLYANGSYGWWQGGLYADCSSPEPLGVFAETDRPVYRPGQEVKFKVTVLSRRKGGWRVYGGGARVKISVSDAGWQNFYHKELSVNDMGSAAGAFTVPAGKLLGQYRVSASVSEYGREFSGQAEFSVEEYKRPEFEVKLASAAASFRYGSPARVEGGVRYYFGSPVPGASVKYTVRRAGYVFPWRGWQAAAPEEAASGETRTGPDGRFFFDFTPSPASGEDDAPCYFDVEVLARDAGGRTIADSRTYRAAAQSAVVRAEPDAGFFFAGAAAGFSAGMTNVNGEPLSGEGSYKIYRLGPPPADYERTSAGPEPGGFRGAEPAMAPFYGGQRSPSLEEIYRSVKDGAEAASGKVVFSTGAPSQIAFAPLPKGVYRLTLSAPDRWGGAAADSAVLVFVDDSGAAPAELPPAAVFEHSSYKPGDTARALVGCGSLKGPKFVEVRAGRNLLSRFNAPAGAGVVDIKIGAEHAGGFALGWFGASDFRFYSASARAEVPRADRELSVTVQHEDSFSPGQKAEWKLRASDGTGRPVSGEALVKVYDRSLEYYGRDAQPWPAMLYPPRDSQSGFSNSLLEFRGWDMPVESGPLTALFQAAARFAREAVRPFMTRAWGGRVFRTMSAGGAVKSMDAAAVNLAAAPQAASAVMLESFAGAGTAVMTAKSESLPSRPRRLAAPVRRDFSETAYYNPQLKVLSGAADFAFTVPERLTSWKASAYVMTRDVKTGNVSFNTATVKPLMARAELPRFLREGDRSVIKTVVSNGGNNPLAGEAALSITAEGGAEAGEAFSLDAAPKKFALEPLGTVSLEWEVQAPQGPRIYKVAASARAGGLADAQENELPVLPSRPRQAASAFAVLEGDASARLELPELANSSGAEYAQLQIEPQLALTLLNSLPALEKRDYDCVEQLVDRYVPLAVVNALYGSYLNLAASAAKIPSRSSITPPWETDNPARRISLEETPWAEVARGRPASANAVDLLNPALVEDERKRALDKLAQYQLEDGGFPWFPGGQADLYMTLYVLDGFAQAEAHGVDAPREITARAARYVAGAAPRLLGDDTKPPDLALAVYAAYVMSSFPEQWPDYEKGFALARKWAGFAGEFSDMLTAYGKARLAYAWLRLGNSELADRYLSAAMDGAIRDEYGTHWAQEKNSWLWYNDTTEKHAFMLRALLALRPDSPDINGLARWLLLNRKNNEWKSPKAAAAAVFALTDLLKKRGALEKAETFSVNWAGTDVTEKIGPYDWLAKPLRYALAGAGARSGADARVAKTGPGTAYCWLNAVYTPEGPVASSPLGMLNISRRFFARVKDGGGYTLRRLLPGAKVNAGDLIEVHLVITARSQFEYVHARDMRGAGFENEGLSSGWKWDLLSRYEEPRDSMTDFFIQWLPQGEYTLKYSMRPATPGVYTIGPAEIQSMYAPEFSAHSDEFRLEVKP